MPPLIKLQALKSPKMPTGQQYAKAMQARTQKTAALTLRDLESTTRTWKTKVAFDVTITQTGANYAVTAGTDNQIWGWVNSGTKPHTIRPKRSKYLRFSSGYKAKTRVGIIGSIEGGAFGSDVFSAGVKHPGFKGRGFTQAIQKRRQKTMEQEISQGIAEVARTAK
jgi:hypothetical protein